MTTHVIITTYNRPESFAEVVRAVQEHPGAEIHAYNDGSTVTYPKIEGVDMHRTHHHGRMDYRHLVARAFKRAQNARWDRIAMLPDDVSAVGDDPLNDAEQIWHRIRDRNKVVLGMLVDARGHVRQWGSNYPVHAGPAYLSGWNDLCFYSDARLRPMLPRGFTMLPGIQYAGSGVGAAWTRHLRERGNIWTVADTLWQHHDGPSVMCPEERVLNPL